MAASGIKFTSNGGNWSINELFDRSEAHLDYLSACELHIDGAESAPIAFPEEESLLFNLKGAVSVSSGGTDFDLASYDVLYLPKGADMRFSHRDERPGHLYVYRAVAETVHEPFVSRFEEAKSNEERIRRLSRKIVYKMLDVSDPADKFIAGYTFYEDHTRAWPPHNHTDQEEVYSFIEGNGAMSVYEDEEHQTFVTSVGVGDHITIPVLNYHPVFSHDEPLAFIWCIAGERYWVGDKDTEFMKGTGKRITT